MKSFILGLTVNWVKQTADDMLSRSALRTVVVWTRVVYVGSILWHPHARIVGIGADVGNSEMAAGEGIRCG